MGRRLQPGIIAEPCWNGLHWLTACISTPVFRAARPTPLRTPPCAQNTCPAHAPPRLQPTLSCPVSPGHGPQTLIPSPRMRSPRAQVTVRVIGAIKPALPCTGCRARDKGTLGPILRLFSVLRMESHAQVTVRVIGARPIEGAAVVSLKPSVVEGDKKRLGQLAVGALVSGHVSRLEDFGVFVDLSRSLKCVSGFVLDWFESSIPKKNLKKAGPAGSGSPGVRPRLAPGRLWHFCRPQPLPQVRLWPSTTDITSRPTTNCFANCLGQLLGSDM